MTIDPPDEDIQVEVIPTEDGVTIVIIQRDPAAQKGWSELVKFDLPQYLAIQLGDCLIHPK